MFDIKVNLVHSVVPVLLSCCAIQVYELLDSFKSQHNQVTTNITFRQKIMWISICIEAEGLRGV